MALLLADVGAVVVAVPEPDSVPPIPLQIMLPIAADVVDTWASVMVELPITIKEQPGARLTGVSLMVAEGLPGVSVVPAMTIGCDGEMTTGLLSGPFIVVVAIRMAGLPPAEAVEVGVGRGGEEVGAVVR